jgi:hypothetical protein
MAVDPISGLLACRMTRAGVGFNAHRAARKNGSGFAGRIDRRS